MHILLIVTFEHGNYQFSKLWLIKFSKCSAVSHIFFYSWRRKASFLQKTPKTQKNFRAISCYILYFKFIDNLNALGSLHFLNNFLKILTCINIFYITKTAIFGLLPSCLKVLGSNQNEDPILPLMDTKHLGKDHPHGFDNCRGT